MREWAERRREWLALGVVLALGTAMLVDLTHISIEAPFGILIEGETLVYTRDFPSHLRFVREVWFGRNRDAIAQADQGGSLYSPYAHYLIKEHWLDGRLGRHEGPWQSNQRLNALPFGYSPTMCYILAPFTVLPDLIAFWLWSALGIAAAWWVCRTLSPLTSLIILISPIAWRCISHGQTGFLATAGLVFLYLESRREQPRFGWMALVLWALTAKPPLALTAGVALIALRQWRPVVYALGLALLTTLLITPWLGSAWVRDYLTMIGNYDFVRAHPLFSWCLYPSYMSCLRSMLTIYLSVPDDVSARLSMWLYLPALALVAWRGNWAAAIMVTLLLAPHVSSTDDLALVIVADVFPVAALIIWMVPGLASYAGLFWPFPAVVAKVLVSLGLAIKGPWLVEQK